MTDTYPPPPPLEERLRQIHAELSADLADITRIAVAIYDGKTDNLRTLSASDTGATLSNYQVKLAEVPSLSELARTRSDRVLNDLSVLARSDNEHSQRIAGHFGSSYTRPLLDGHRLRGFVFFDAVPRGYFTASVVARLTVYSELIAVMLTQDMMPSRLLKSAVDAATAMSNLRDPETGAHLDRMSRYSLIIGAGLAKSHGITDIQLNHLLMLSPLHDVGKVAIPDDILLKKGRLTDAEMTIMKTHTTRGAELVGRMVGQLNIGILIQSRMLTNIVRSHHERFDGAGYPDGLTGTDIPIEARIVTVADVYDALTTERPYKSAWSAEDACAYLDEHRGTMFDPDVVAAFHASYSDIEQIRHTFAESSSAVFREGYDADI